MAKRYPTDTEEELAAKRQRLGLSTAGEDSLVFEGDTSHFLAELYNTVTTPGRFSDVTLEFKYGDKMEGHSVVLAAMSPFMKPLFSDKLKLQSPPFVDLRSITKGAFMKLLDYTFHGRLQVEFGDKLEEVLNAARLLQLVEIRVKCEEELERRLTVANCLRTIQLAERSNLHKLVEATERFVAANLKEVSQTAGWWIQTEAEFTVVCRAAKRHVANPETLAEAILEWLKWNAKDPGIVTRLMRTNVFPLGDLSVDYITSKLMPHRALKGNHEAIKIASDAIQAKLKCSPISTPAHSKAYRDTTPGASSGTPAGQSAKQAEQSTKPAGQSATPAGQSAKPAGQSATPAGQSTKPAGQSAKPAGQSAKPAEQSAKPAEQSVTPAAKPGEKKENARPKMLLVAGWTSNESVLYCWKWGSTSWDKIPMPRHGLGAAMLYFNNQVIVTGGRVPETSQKEGEENRIVKYTPLAKTSFVKLQTGNSTDGPQMLKARSDHGMVKIGKSVYVAGGDNLNVEEYNSDRKTWTVAGKLHSKAKKCGVGALGDVILVVGGSVKGNEKIIQAFDTRTRVEASLVGLLPMAMPEIRCAGANQGKIVCLSKEGKMLQIAGEEDKYATTPIKDLREMTADFDAFISGQHIVACTGHLKDEVRVDSKRSVFLKYKVQDGKEVDCEIPSLPELVRVYGLTTTRIAF